MLTDLQIANSTKLEPIENIAKNLEITPDEIEFYGKYKAKINDKIFKRLENKKSGKLVLVTATNPTPAGEGKTTITIGLGQAMHKLKKKVVIALREPSLGPVFGIKGGAAGGGYSQVLPMEDINLHFTGDMHAITTANNLLCALVDNHIHQGNELKIDPKNILIKRCLDINDRALRNIIVGLGEKINGTIRPDSFVITVATEIMAILCLSKDLKDLKQRLGRILVAYDTEGKPVYAEDLKANGAMTVLLKEAIKPNLVQTIEHTPVLVHGGPFANIAHGCNSVRATKLALKLGDYCVTEAGFGADLGAEKFLDIKCRVSNLKPNCIVLVTTIRSLKYNSTDAENKISEIGLKNLETHIENMRKYNVPLVVTLNHFSTDSEEEIETVRKFCESKNCSFTVSKAFSDGSEGCLSLANEVFKACELQSNYKPIYDLNLSIKEKILKVATEIYRASNVTYSQQAEKAIKAIENLGQDKLPICIAKTQYSLSDDPSKLGCPREFTINVKDITISNGAGFIVVLTGNIMTMPGLPKVPAANNIDIDESGNSVGIF